MARDVSLGKDPAREREQTRKAPTVSDLFERYLVEHARPFKKPASLRNDERIIDKVLRPPLGHLKVQDVSREDVLRLHGAMADRPYEANRMLALLSKMFNLAELWELRPDGSNPTRHINRFKEVRRERLLSEQELARLGAVLRRAEQGPLTDNGGNKRLIFPPAIVAIRLLLFTGARTSEVLGLKREWIN